MPVVYVTGLGAACSSLRNKIGWSRERAASALDVCATTLFRWEHAEDTITGKGEKRQPLPSRTFSAQLNRFREVYTQQMQREPSIQEFARKQDAMVALGTEHTKKRKGK